MAVTTVRVACAAGSYTALSSGQENVSFEATGGGGRMVIATSQPAANEVNYKTVKGGDIVELGGLGGTDNVYWLPSQGSGDVIEVIKG